MKNNILFTCLPRAINLGTQALLAFLSLTTINNSFKNSFAYQSIRPYSTTNNSTSEPVVPIKIYGNADTMRLNILKENKGKVGIYRWLNKTSRTACFGSSINLYKRFQTHYSIDYLMKTRYKNTKINRAFFKYGYSNFSLHILEYCDVSVLLEREQYYLDLFEPQDLRSWAKAGNSLGFKHSPESKKKMSAIKSGKTISQSTKNKISATLTGKITSRGSRDEISRVNGTIIFVYSSHNQLLYSFHSFRRTPTEFFNCSHPTIRKYVRSGEIFKDKFILSLEELPLKE